MTIAINNVPENTIRRSARIAALVPRESVPTDASILEKSAVRRAASNNNYMCHNSEFEDSGSEYHSSSEFDFDSAGVNDMMEDLLSAALESASRFYQINEESQQVGAAEDASLQSMSGTSYSLPTSDAREPSISYSTSRLSRAQAYMRAYDACVLCTHTE